jgi:AraC family transcriptional activator of pyochelin receptor
MKSMNYMIQNLALASSQYGKIQCSPAFSPPVATLFTDSCDDDVLSLQASGPFGSLLFHEIKNENFSIRHNEYRLAENLDISTAIGMQSLALLFTMKSNMRFTIKGFPQGFILKHQYNMVYVPEVQWDYIFRKSEEYACFGIHFTTEYLQRCSETFPLLPEFMGNVRRKTPAFISPTHHPSATAEMMSIIQSILCCDYTGTLKRMYLDSKVPELLLLSLQHIVRDTAAMKVSLRDADLRKIQHAKEYIILHMDNPGTLKELAHEVGINDFKLKNGFKQMYGTTVFGLLLEERMKKARALLQDSDMTIQEISTMTGYKNLSNFTAAFKRKFGYPPSAMKNGLSPAGGSTEAEEEEEENEDSDHLALNEV